MTFKVGDLVQSSMGWPNLVHQITKILPSGRVKMRYWNSVDGHTKFENCEMHSDHLVPANEMLVLALASR